MQEQDLERVSRIIARQSARAQVVAGQHFQHHVAAVWMCVLVLLRHNRKDATPQRQHDSSL